MAPSSGSTTPKREVDSGLLYSVENPRPTLINFELFALFHDVKTDRKRNSGGLSRSWALGTCHSVTSWAPIVYVLYYLCSSCPPPPLHCALDNYGRRRSRTRISKKTLKKHVRKQPSYTVTLIIVVTIDFSYFIVY
jgi:hypothetical protein